MVNPLERSSIRLLMILKEQMYRDALLLDLSERLEIELVGESSKGMDAIPWFGQRAASTLVVEENLPDTDGLTVAEMALVERPSLNVVLLVDSLVSKKRLAIYLDSGIKSVISKTQPFKDLVDAINYTRNGQLYIAAEHYRQLEDASESLSPEQSMRAQYYSLSEREREVAHLIAQQWPSSKIADKLGVSNKTVHTYKDRIFIKLGFERMSELILFTQRLSYMQKLEEVSDD